MPRIVIDYDPALPDAPQIEGDSSDLVYFLSWAFSARYGGNHEMSLASLVLRGEFGIDLRPLLTFADREVEMEADAEMLEKAWQDGSSLAECCEAIVVALGSGDQRLATLGEEYPRLSGQIDALGRLARQAAAHGSRLRVTFSMDEAEAP